MARRLQESGCEERFAVPRPAPGLDHINVQLPHRQNPQLRIQIANTTWNQTRFEKARLWRIFRSPFATRFGNNLARIIATLTGGSP